MKTRMKCISLFLFLFVSLYSFSSIAKMTDLSMYKKYGAKSQKWNALVESGIESFDAGSFATGYMLLNQAYINGCRDPLVLFKLGIYDEKRDLYLKSSRLLSESARSFRRVYPSHSEARRISAHAMRSAFMANDYITAAQFVDSAVSQKNADVTTLLIASQIYLNENNWKKSISILRRAKKKVKSDDLRTLVSICRMLINAYLNIDNVKMAEYYVSELLLIAPNDQYALRYQEKIKLEKQRKMQENIIKSVSE